MEINKFGQRSLITWTAEDLRKEREAEIQMRQYRGLTKDGNWVYGWYLQLFNPKGKAILLILKTRISSISWYEVIPETIGQFTGLKDKNGKEIYEGDIVRDVTINPVSRNWWNGVVTWHDAGSVGWVAEPLPENKHRGAWGLNYNYEYEVIGNIHQNPELMEQDNG